MLERWFASYGLYIAVSVAAIIISAVALKTIYKKKTMSKSPAYNIAKVTLLWQEATKQYDDLANKLERLQADYKTFVEDEFIFNYNHMTDTEISTSMAKLALLFPNVPEKVIRRRVHKYNTEEQVVEKFIEEGHEMRKIFITNQHSIL